MEKSDILLFDKKEGITSFSSLNQFKREYGKKVKIGHAGTLDKFASGLMIVLVGGATKLNPVFSSFDKSYVAAIKFGFETDTLDPEGKVIKEGPIPEEAMVDEALSCFVGEILQSPPAYSAIHIGGKRAYEEARKGRDVQMPLRPVKVFSAEKISYEEGTLICSFRVSKGTYIRSLARDIAYRAGTCAHLSALRRTSIGPYTLDDIGRYSYMELLEKTGLFSSISLDPKRKKEIDNGFISSSAILSDSDRKKAFKFLYFGSELYAVSAIQDGKLKIISRVCNEDI